MKQQKKTYFPTAAKDEEMEDFVPPALAKQIIKECLLPLFERRGFPIPGRSTSTAAIKNENKNLCFLGELRLSDQLLADLERTKQESFEMHAKLEESQDIQRALQKELGELRATFNSIILEIKMSQFQESNVRMKSKENKETIAQLRIQLQKEMDHLIQLKSEDFVLSSKLFDEERKVERLSQVVAQNQNASSLAKLTNDILAEEVKNLHSAVTSLSDVDKLANELLANTKGFDELEQTQHEEKEEIEIALARVYDERNHFDNAKRELATHQEWLIQELQRMTNEFDDSKQKNEKEILALYEEKEALRKERDKIEKKLRDVSENRDKLKQKMKKYRARRKMFDAERKRCKKCGKDYTETENFNWSCRTHQSDFGGVMWWCCGKIGKDAIGCKFTKHESKDDDDDLDEQERKEKAENESVKKNLKVRCYSCKEVGHLSKDCIRDPNMRTSYNPEKEMLRVSQLSLASRKLVRLMRGEDVANTVNEKCGYAVLDGSFGDDKVSPFDDLVYLSRDSRQSVVTLDGKGALDTTGEADIGEEGEDDEYYDDESGSGSQQSNDNQYYSDQSLESENIEPEMSIAVGPSTVRGSQQEDEEAMDQDVENNHGGDIEMTGTQ